ncbi:MAG: hypothetical protein J1E63_05705 [Muribaculaceae bacterium]|nr:hypothetical protein [Muribaculaceae bacterium]
MSASHITEKDVNAILHRLDNELKQHERYLQTRTQRIDSLERLISNRIHDRAWLSIVEQIADVYASYDNDSVLAYLARGQVAAAQAGLDSLERVFIVKRAVYMPLAGLSNEALFELQRVDRDSLMDVGGDIKRLYLDSERQLYSYMASLYGNYTPLRQQYESHAVESQRQLLEVLNPGSVEYRFNRGEYFFNTGDFPRAEVILKELIDSLPENNKFFARAANKMSQIAKNRGLENEYVYYLTLSAIGDVKSATLEVSSLQTLGRELFKRGDAQRSYNYLSMALDNAVRCHAVSRMLESAEALPIISEAHRRQSDTQRHIMTTVISLMAVLLLLLGGVLFVLRRDMKRLKLMRANLVEANRVKEVYISQFLNLSSIYMDKLNDFCKIAQRKIAAGKVDDLYRLTKSGKLVEEQSAEFYEVFDNAFLHLYPSFIDDVNALLRPDSQVAAEDIDKLSTDLRILALMRLGLDDCGHIARVLNYSVNTIYAYRNKLKNKAINRDTFEDDIMKIGQNSTE